MTDTELKKLRRAELLELFLEQSREVKRLSTELKEAKQDLEDKKIIIDKAGSLAEASLQLNGVFDAAQKAAEQYLLNMESMMERTTLECQNRNEESQQARVKVQEFCDKMKQDTQDECRKLKEETEGSCQNLKQNTEDECKRLKEETEASCQSLKQNTEDECKQLKEETQEACLKQKSETQEQCQNKLEETDRMIEEKWNQISTRLEAFYQAHEGLKELIEFDGKVLK